MAETCSTVVDLNRWWKCQFVSDRRIRKENPKQILKESIDLRYFEKLASGDVTALLQQHKCVIQGANVDHNLLFLGGKEDIHIGHVLTSRVLTAGHN